MRENVLVIDDCAMTSRLLVAHLSREQLNVRTAANGADGLNAARDDPPDLILLDVQMPGIDGFEVCRRLKADPQTMQAPVIFLTGESESDQMIMGLDLGATDYVVKPFNAAELLARVRAALRHKRLVDLLAERAQVDALTGLWNRAYFDQQIERHVAGASRRDGAVGLVMADLDHFKSHNDTYGHTFGDRVLQAMGQLLQINCRAEDSPCRYGGEEFGIIVPESSPAEIATFAERLRVAVDALDMACDGKGVPVTASFGVATHGGRAAGSTGVAVRSLIERADRNLYRAKQAGRNRVMADEALPVGV